ncbi:MAG: tRNA dihydrouridine synthase [Planctomycetota bacterium]|jgi:tRNA-dihydrouridine synthase C
MDATANQLLRTPLEITGRAGRRSVRFPNRILLAPMEGVTDRIFRRLVLDLGGAGGASTEFVRISSHVVKTRVIARELGPSREGVPVAVQLMAAGTDYLAETIGNAESAGADWIDLNFGCPVRRVCGRGAGSALLDDPERLGQIVRETVASTERPVSAKVRLGVRDTSRLDEILDAAGEGGAAAITLHGRMRTESYAAPAHWDWIAHAAERVHARFPGVVFVGNGGVDTADDAHRMQRETRCDAVMVGRAAIANPFLFNEAMGAPPATEADAAGFALRYFESMEAESTQKQVLGRLKQMLRVYRAGGMFEGADAQRSTLLRSREADEVREYLRARV